MHVLSVKLHLRDRRTDGRTDAANTQGGPKSKPLPNYQKIVLYRIKVVRK